MVAALVELVDALRRTQTHSLSSTTYYASLMRHSLPLMLSCRLGDFAANGDEVVQECVVARLDAIVLNWEETSDVEGWNRRRGAHQHFAVERGVGAGEDQGRRHRDARRLLYDPGRGRHGRFQRRGEEIRHEGRRH